MAAKGRASVLGFHNQLFYVLVLLKCSRNVRESSLTDCADRLCNVALLIWTNRIYFGSSNSRNVCAWRVGGCKMAAKLCLFFGLCCFSVSVFV